MEEGDRSDSRVMEEGSGGNCWRGGRGDGGGEVIAAGWKKEWMVGRSSLAGGRWEGEAGRVITGGLGGSGVRGRTWGGGS